MTAPAVRRELNPQFNEREWCAAMVRSFDAWTVAANALAQLGNNAPASVLRAARAEVRMHRGLWEIGKLNGLGLRARVRDDELYRACADYLRSDA